MRYKKKDYRAAIDDLSSAVSVDRSLSKAFYYRGLCKRALGDTAGALSDFGVMIMLQPKESRAWYESGRTKIARGDFAGAVTDLRQAKVIYPGAYAYSYHLARALFGMGKAGQAMAEGSNALTLRADYPEALKLKAEIYTALRR